MASPEATGASSSLSAPTHVQQSPEEIIKRIATFSPLEYEVARKAEAKALGIRPTALDTAVKDARRNIVAQEDFPIRRVEPSPSPVDPGNLLNELVETIRRFIVCQKETAYAAALWIAMTWFIDVIQVAPLAVITAPEKRCGKSQLLSLMEKLTFNPIAASNISPAALFRAIEAWRPTLLIDEADSFMRDNEELRGVLNSGHTRDSAYVIRTVGDKHTPTRFNTWGAKALAGIGGLPDTLMDRAIVLELRRKLPAESVERIRNAERSLFDSLRSRLARFAEDYDDQVRHARPPLPKQLNDRAQDNWEPLLAIAMVAGEDFLQTATAVALKISAHDDTPQTTGTELLAAIRDIFRGMAGDRISSADLIKQLCLDDERPWATFNSGRAISPAQLAKQLKAYNIRSRTIRYNSGTIKGYDRGQFEDAFSRYVPDPPPEA